MSRLTAALVALVLPALLAPAPAAAEYLTGDRSRDQGPAPEAEFWEYQNQPYLHDKGFVLRLTAAPMWFVSRTRQVGRTFSATELRFEGGGLDAGAAFGGTVAPNLALHGTVTALVVPSPRVVIEDVSTNADGVGMVLIGFGPGITGYLPNDVWGSLSLGGAAQLLRFDHDAVAEPDTGFGIFFEMSAGKEWWVGPYAGVGVFGRLTTHRVTTDYAEPFGGVSISFGVSTTLN